MQRPAMIGSYVSSKMTENTAKFTVQMFSKNGLIAKISSTEIKVFPEDFPDSIIVLPL